MDVPPAPWAQPLPAKAAAPEAEERGGTGARHEAAESAPVCPATVSLCPQPHTPPPAPRPLKDSTLQTKDIFAKGRQAAFRRLARRPRARPHTQAGWHRHPIALTQRVSAAGSAQSPCAGLRGGRKDTGRGSEACCCHPWEQTPLLAPGPGVGARDREPAVSGLTPDRFVLLSTTPSRPVPVGACVVIRFPVEAERDAVVWVHHGLSGLLGAPGDATNIEDAFLLFLGVSEGSPQSPSPWRRLAGLAAASARHGDGVCVQ